ncbi:hypothetical protein NL154_05715 [Rhizobium sp. YTUHZ044]|uniref:hypothetical protein n=1 Tax=Rhizobium sp. YTUHZ044 TaxID=2962678 RepID=UPI003DA91130
MPFDANGNFSLSPSYLAVAGQVIQPSQHNPPLEDIAISGLSQVLVRDGRAPMTGALNLNGFKITNLLAGSNSLDAINKTQLDAQATALSAAIAAAVANMEWKSRFIGEVVYANTAVTGASLPPSSTTGTVWIELTSGLTGVGQFNNAKLTSESISGSAPLVLATAVINYAGSPMNGQTIRLINTESRILRPSISPGTIQDDAFQGHRHSLSSSVFTGGAGSLGTSSGNTNPLSIGDPTTDGTNGTPRTANETRMKNIGVKAYMRIA